MSSPPLLRRSLGWNIDLFAGLQRQSTICELLFPTSVLAVKLNRKRMVVVLEEEIYIYNVSTMKLLHTIETSPNPEGALGFISREACAYR